MTDYTSLPPDLVAPEDDGATAHVVGQPAPALVLEATDATDVDLAALGSGRTVIYLYPMTGNPGHDMPAGWDAFPGARGCTPESCSFRDHHQELRDAGAHRVLGLSSQPRGYQRELVERLELPYPLLSDELLALAAALGLPTFTVGGMRLYKRQTLVLCDNVIEHVLYPVFPPNEHALQVLNWLRRHPVDASAPSS